MLEQAERVLELELAVSRLVDGVQRRIAHEVVDHGVEDLEQIEINIVRNGIEIENKLEI